MPFELYRTMGTPLDRQQFSWRELAPPPYSKLDDDAFTRMRIIWVAAMTSEAVRFCHACARMNAPLRAELAWVRRVEHHQQTLASWLHPPDLSRLEQAVIHEQAEVEIVAAAARREPSAAIAPIYRGAVLEHLDHLYRFAAALDRFEGLDANTLLQSYTDILPAAPTASSHRHPVDCLEDPYARAHVAFPTRLHALMVGALANHMRDILVEQGAIHAEPTVRQLVAEIASAEEQHATTAGSVMDPTETWLEQWLVHEATEVYVCWSCAETERNPRMRRIWERFLEHELGHFHAVRVLFEDLERRDAASVVPGHLPEPLSLVGQRSFIRDLLEDERRESAAGMDVAVASGGPVAGQGSDWARVVNADGSPSSSVAAGWRWTSGTELARRSLRRA